MGAIGALIMSFFGALFASMTLVLQLHWAGPMLGLPFLAFAAVAIAAAHVLRLPGQGVSPSKQGERVILWSSIGEGIGLFLAVNILVNIGHRDLLLPTMALVVGLHFLPMAWSVPFKPFYMLGSALIIAAITGFAVTQPLGGALAGFAAAAGLTTAAILAVWRDRRARSCSVQAEPSPRP